MRKTLFILGIAVIFLSACKERETESYFLANLGSLRQTMEACQQLNPVAREADKSCDVAFKAATRIDALVSEWQAAPEQFGKRIMMAQLALTEAQQAACDQLVKVKQLKADKASTETVAKAERLLDTLNVTLKEKRNEVTAMMSVVGLASPE